MGRPVWTGGGSKPTSALNDFIVAETYVRSTTLWSCSVVSMFNYPYIPIQGQGGAAWKMRVNGVDAAELYIARGYLEPTVVVIPWGNGIRGNGLRFSDGTRLHWNVSSNVGQFFCWASWIGAED